MPVSRETVLACSDRRIEEVEIPDWGGKMSFQSLPAEKWADWMQLYWADVENNEVKSLEGMIQLIILSAVAEDGSPIFQSEDIGELKKKSGGNIRKAFFAAWAANGASSEVQDEIEGNSEAGGSSGGNTSTPED